ncbi:hypothetical protein COCON_G00212210 [Conger conger]|uniref:Uncharacterized protein n=1 Tax=Conger conger TaxID=82655 RepID=A0A9Q1CXR9_CONCO|nr:hypothetical protein COCON_G00212210 [Conger conger]
MRPQDFLCLTFSMARLWSLNLYLCIDLFLYIDFGSWIPFLSVLPACYRPFTCDQDYILDYP